MKQTQSRMFVLADGRNVVVTFVLVSSLFLLWGFCNGMIDVMDKHFQTELHLTLAQSAWVQFAHYLGYFLMALPAGWLATKLGYKGGIITGLLMVAVGGFWFIPATSIASFWAFLLGVCVIAAGLTFLETIANPYTTVLGDAALRRHAHQPRAVLQRHRLDLRPDRRRRVLLRQGRERARARARRRCGFRTPPSASSCSCSWRSSSSSPTCPTSRWRTTTTSTTRGRHASHSIWTHPHFAMAVVGAVPLRGGAGRHLQLLHQLHDVADAAAARVVDDRARSRAGSSGGPSGALQLTDQGAANLASLGFVFFLVGRFTGAAILQEVFAAHRVLGLYGVAQRAVPAWSSS